MNRSSLPGVRFFIGNRDGNIRFPPCIARYTEDAPDDELKIYCLGKTECIKIEAGSPSSFRLKIKEFLVSMSDEFSHIDYEAQIAEASKDLSREVALRIFAFYNDNGQYRQAFLWLKKLCFFGNPVDREELIKWLRTGKGCHRDRYLAFKMMGRYKTNIFDVRPKEDFFLAEKNF